MQCLLKCKAKQTQILHRQNSSCIQSENRESGGKIDIHTTHLHNRTLSPGLVQALQLKNEDIKGTIRRRRTGNVMTNGQIIVGKTLHKTYNWKIRTPQKNRG